MRVCPKCRVSKSENEYHPSRVLTGYCKQCSNAKSKEHYQAHKDIALARTKRNTKIRKGQAQEFIVGYLKQHPCVDCGEDDIIVLEFDHVRGKKKGNIGHMVTYGRSIEEIVEEISKCDVRCANCHKRRTGRQLGYYRSRNIPA